MIDRLIERLIDRLAKRLIFRLLIDRQIETYDVSKCEEIIPFQVESVTAHNSETV